MRSSLALGSGGFLKRALVPWLILVPCLAQGSINRERIE